MTTERDGIPWNVIPDSAADVDASQMVLKQTQPDDQIEEGRKWEERIRKGNASGSAKPN